MNKLKSFEQFATEVKISQTRQVEEDKVTKRSNEAETYKSLLSEFKVTSIKELTEDQRSEFFNRLRGAEVNEALSLIEEGTRGQFGKIDKKGNITSVYTHYDSYPENMLPIIKKSFLKGKLVDDVIKRGDNSGLDVSIDKINFYGDNGKPTTGSIADVKGYLRTIADRAGAEYAYLWDEANKEWLMADIYGGNGELVPAFESVSVSVNEAIAVQFKRDAKKVLTVYNNLFAKKLTDFGAMSIETKLGCIKYLFECAMEDANFSREGFVISKNIKGSIGSFEVKMPGLGNYFIKIGATTTKRILDQYYSELANAAGWSGIGIVEGTALYLEQIKQEAAGQSLLNAFNMSESLVTEASISGIEFGNDDGIHPTKHKPLTISLKKNKVKMEVEKEKGDHGYPEVKLTGKRKDIEKVLADIWGPDSIDDYEDYFESLVIEGAKFKSTKDFEDFLEEIDGMGDFNIKKIMGKEYIDTPGFYQDEKEDYDNDIIEFMISNMGTKEFEKLKSWWENNVAESVVTEKLAKGLKPLLTTGTTITKNDGEDALIKLSDEFDRIDDEYAGDIASHLDMAIELMQDGYGGAATNKLKQFNKACKDVLKGKEIGSAFESVVTEAEVNSDEEFNEYGMTVLQKAFGEEFDETKAKKVIDGILAKSKGDYGTAVGMLTSSLGA